VKSLLGKGQKQVHATSTMQTLIENAEKKKLVFDNIELETKN
jgi:hypothetical protein